MGHGIKLPRQAGCSRELSKGEPYKEGSRQWVQVQLLLISQCTQSSGLPSAELSISFHESFNLMYAKWCRHQQLRTDYRRKLDSRIKLFYFRRKLCLHKCSTIEFNFIIHTSVFFHIKYYMQYHLPT